MTGPSNCLRFLRLERPQKTESHVHDTQSFREGLRLVRLPHSRGTLISNGFVNIRIAARENRSYHRPGPLTAEPSALLPGTYTGP